MSGRHLLWAKTRACFLYRRPRRNNRLHSSCSIPLSCRLFETIERRAPSELAGGRPDAKPFLLSVGISSFNHPTLAAGRHPNVTF
jgi:hypothetical protein